jgi:hypothetical protein
VGAELVYLGERGDGELFVDATGVVRRGDHEHPLVARETVELVQENSAVMLADESVQVFEGEDARCEQGMAGRVIR